MEAVAHEEGDVADEEDEAMDQAYFSASSSSSSNLHQLHVHQQNPATVIVSVSCEWWVWLMHNGGCGFGCGLV